MSESKASGKIWEDTVIIAFRDLQWIHWSKEVAKQLKQSDLNGDALAEIPQPGNAHKLDGHAESRFADIIAHAGSRFFLFEFKGDRDGHRAEHGKSVFERLGVYVADVETEAAQSDDGQAIDRTQSEHSRKCHFGVFASQVINEHKKDQANGNVVSPFTLETIVLNADPYWEWVKLENKRLAYEQQKNTLDKYLRVEADKDKAQADHDVRVSVITRKLSGQGKQGEEPRKKRIAKSKLMLDTQIAAIEDVAERRRSRSDKVLKKLQPIPKEPTIDDSTETKPLKEIIWGKESNPSEHGLEFKEFLGYLEFLLRIQKHDNAGNEADVRLNLVGVDAKGIVALVTVSFADLKKMFVHGLLDRYLKKLKQKSTLGT